jgi:Flp pilus assembly protein TadD
VGQSGFRPVADRGIGRSQRIRTRGEAQVGAGGADSTGVRSDVLLDQAGDLLHCGRAGQAATLLTPVVGEEPDNVGAWLLLSRARLALGRPAEALDAAREALHREPRGMEALFWVSAAYTGMGRHDLAITAAEAACAEEPGHPRLLERHGRALLAGGRVAEAERVLSAAAEIAHYDADLHVAHGCALFAAARPMSARAAYGQALRIDPEHRRARTELRRLATAERTIVDADSLIRAADDFAEQLRIPAGGVRPAAGHHGVLAHVSAVVFGVCLVALLGLGVLIRVTPTEVPAPLLATLICAAASAACVTLRSRRAP